MENHFKWMIVALLCMGLSGIGCTYSLMTLRGRVDELEKTVSFLTAEHLKATTIGVPKGSPAAPRVSTPTKLDGLTPAKN